MDALNWLTAGGSGLAKSVFSNMNSWQNPASAALPGLNKIPGMMQPYYNPFIERGANAGNVLQDQFGELSHDPGARLNEIGAGYQQSPGFQFALQQALQAGNHAAAAGGMAGSPQHEQQNMELATQLANQDYGNWMQRALGLYGTGLSGESSMYGTGYDASNELAQSLANAMLSKAHLGYAGQNAENMHRGGMFGSMLGAAGTGVGAMFGGVPGAMVGSQLGRMGGSY